jgi:hypothetical protein
MLYSQRLDVTWLQLVVRIIFECLVENPSPPQAQCVERTYVERGDTPNDRRPKHKEHWQGAWESRTSSRGRRKPTKPWVFLVTGPLPAMPFVVCRRYLIVMPKPQPAVPLAVCRRHLIVAPRPLPAAAAPLVVCRRYLIVVPRPSFAAPKPRTSAVLFCL